MRTGALQVEHLTVGRIWDMRSEAGEATSCAMKRM